VAFDRIEVVVHPQSLVHSMVEFADGSTIAQLSPPDMRLPIALGLSWPERVADAQPPMDWTAPVHLDFEPLDTDAFPAVALARHAGESGGAAPGVFNAANEEAVGAFLAGAISFGQIVRTVEIVLSEHLASRTVESDLGLAEVLAAESWARHRARQLVGPVPADVAGVS
jgi:1-deoxy-D-xylulose-5-phosphate reductoisomerase